MDHLRLKHFDPSIKTTDFNRDNWRFSDTFDSMTTDEMPPKENIMDEADAAGDPSQNFENEPCHTAAEVQSLEHPMQDMNTSSERKVSFSPYQFYIEPLLSFI
jgi:hypothetical protein